MRISDRHDRSCHKYSVITKLSVRKPRTWVCVSGVERVSSALNATGATVYFELLHHSRTSATFWPQLERRGEHVCFLAHVEQAAGMS